LEKVNRLINYLLGDESFHHYVYGTASRREQEKWKRWSDESSEHKEAFMQAYKLLHELRFVPAYSLSVDKRWRRFYGQLNRVNRVRSFSGPSIGRKNFRSRVLIRYAVVLCFVSLAAIGYRLISQSRKAYSKHPDIADVTVTTGYRQQKIFAFSKGSKIILSPNSRLIHKSDWLREKIKKVRLEGQAYFDIAETQQDGNVKFDVVTSFGTVRDIGTAFNVSTFNNQMTVVLKRGIVNVTPSWPTGQLRSVQLKPGQMATITSGDHRMTVREVNTRVYTSWTTKTLYFYHTPLRTFINDIRNFYGAPVVVCDSALLRKELSGGVDRGGLADMIKVVSNVLSIPMHVSRDTVYVGKFHNNTKQEQE